MQSFRILPGVVLTILVILNSGRTTAQEVNVPELTADEKAAADGIRIQSVTSTVSFLASDEMAGRDTPSKELEIAAAYVAARFRGAGLEGLGANGSFYQTTELEQFGPPATEGTLMSGGKAIAVLGTAFGGDEAKEIRSTVATEKEDFSGRILVIDEVPIPPQASSNSAMVAFVLARRLSSLAQKGASAILIRVGSESLLPDAVRSMKKTPVSLPAQLRISIPVLLIANDTLVDGEVTLNGPPRLRVTAPVHNVVGIVRGTDPAVADECILITAHLDHIGTLAGDGQGDRINNGADDNATGVTAVVTLADAYAALEQKPARSVIFMTFWGEEDGLLGSKYYAQNPLWPLEKTVANINIEMIGRPEEGAAEKMWGTGWARSTLGLQMAAGARRLGIEVFNREDVGEMLYSRSDNYSLVQKGVIAHSFSAGSLHPDYHQPTDEVSRLNLPHMTRIIQGLFAGSLPIARNQLTPVATETK